MEQTEPIESINKQLTDLFGMETNTGRPIWRIVFSDEQFEKRYGTYDDYCGQMFLRTVTELREIPKYPHDKGRYILERLVLIPEINAHELPTSKFSYEPIWTFEDRYVEPVPPTLQAAKFIIDTVYAAMGKSSLAKYKDPDLNWEDARSNYEKRIKSLEEELFGNESKIGDSLTYKEAVSVQGTKEIN